MKLWYHVRSHISEIYMRNKSDTSENICHEPWNWYMKLPRKLSLCCQCHLQYFSIINLLDGLQNCLVTYPLSWLAFLHWHSVRMLSESGLQKSFNHLHFDVGSVHTSFSQDILCCLVLDICDHPLGGLRSLDVRNICITE